MDVRDMVLGIDIGGTNLRLGLVDRSHKLFGFCRYGTQQVFEATYHPTERLAAYIRAYLAEQGAQGMPRVISIGFPATIDKSRTMVTQTPNIDCLPDNYAVARELQDILKIPVCIDRDVNNLLLFDMEDLGIPADCTVCGIYFGTGIGSAIMIDGKILLGKNGTAAELGHIPVVGNSRRCVCGNIGCVETLISGGALEHIQAERFPGTPINRLFRDHRDAGELQKFVAGMGQVAATEINLIDPDFLILGGGLLQMEDFPKEALEKAIFTYTRKPYPAENLQIRYTRSEQSNGVIGAAIGAEKRTSTPVA